MLLRAGVGGRIGGRVGVESSSLSSGSRFGAELERLLRESESGGSEERV